MVRIDSLRKHCAKQCLDLVIHQALAQTESNPNAQNALARLLAAVYSRTGILHRRIMLKWAAAKNLTVAESV